LNLSLKGKLFLFIYSATHKNWYLLEFCKGCFVNLQNPTWREEMEKFNFFGQAHRSMSSPLSQCSTRPTEQRLFVVSMHAATHAPLVTSPAKAVGWRASYVTPLSRATIKLPRGTIFVFPSLFLLRSHYLQKIEHRRCLNLIGGLPPRRFSGRARPASATPNLCAPLWLGFGVGG
jgi:hypothetical protein